MTGRQPALRGGVQSFLLHTQEKGGGKMGILNFRLLILVKNGKLSKDLDQNQFKRNGFCLLGKKETVSLQLKAQITCKASRFLKWEC